MSCIRLHWVCSCPLHVSALPQLCGWCARARARACACVCMCVCVLQAQGQPCGEWPISDRSLSWQKLDIPLAQRPVCVTQEAQGRYRGTPRRESTVGTQWCTRETSNPFTKCNYAHWLHNKRELEASHLLYHFSAPSIQPPSAEEDLSPGPTAGSCRALRRQSTWTSPERVLITWW